jgi:death-on-curing protein
MIEASELYRLHALGLAAHGGADGVLHAGCVEGKLASALDAQHYEGLDIVGFAATLCFYLRQGHCFRDGNKRIAWAAARRVLELAELRVVATAADVVSFMESLASREDALAWFGAPGRIAAT